METAVKRFKYADDEGNQYTIENHQPYLTSHTLDGPQIFEGLQHFEWNGIRINPPKNGEIFLPGINKKVKLVK